MVTILIELTNKKAYKLIRGLEEPDMIKVLKKQGSVSSLRDKIQ